MNLAVKDHFVLANEKVLRDFNSDAVDRALSSNSLQEFVNNTVEFAGYKDSETYYAHQNPVQHLHHITTPAYVLNSVDDPCCAIGNLYEKSKFKAHNGLSYSDIIMSGPSAIVSVSHLGSHCPFLDGYWPFVKVRRRASEASWENENEERSDDYRCNVASLLVGRSARFYRSYC